MKTSSLKTDLDVVFPHGHWEGPTSMTRNAFTSLCWSSPVSCDADGSETRNPKKSSGVSFTHFWNRCLKKSTFTCLNQARSICLVHQDLKIYVNCWPSKRISYQSYHLHCPLVHKPSRKWKGGTRKVEESWKKTQGSSQLRQWKNPYKL